MSSNQYTVNIVNADELYIGGRKIEALELGVLVSDDPTYGIGIGTDKPRLRLDISGNSGIRIPVGTTSERPVNGRFLNPPNGATNLLGILRYNTTTEKYEAVCDSESLSVDPSWCNFVMETGTVGNNKVGINTGTGIPSQTLDVSGQIGINDYIIHNGDTNTKIGFPTNDTLTITTNGTERMRVDSSGKVGIGVGHPQTTKSELHVKGSISVYKNARNTDNQAQLANIYLDVNDSGKGSGIIWKPEYDDGSNPYTKDSAGIYFQHEGQHFTGGLSFYTNNKLTHGGVAEERMRIDASGKVGIGTTSPDYKLEVSTTTATDDPDFTTPGGVTPSWYGSLHCGHSVNGGITMGRCTRNGANESSAHYNGIQSRSTQNGSSLAINPFGGNVGIGTNSPGEKLEVNNGYILLKGSTPTIKFYSNNGTHGNEIVSNHSDSGNDGLQIRSRNISFMSPSWHSYCKIQTRYDENTDSGRPHGQLHLYYGFADQNPNLGVFLSASPSESNYINNGGNVGIGTTSPGEKLEVVGKIKCANSSYCSRLDSQHLDAYTSNGSTGSSLFLNWYSKGYTYIGQHLIFGNTTTNYNGGWYMQDTSWIRSYGNKALYISVNNSNDNGICTTGRVGIGTTSPKFPLHITAYQNISYYDYGGTAQFHGNYITSIGSSGWGSTSRYFNGNGNRYVSLKTDYGIWNSGDYFHSSDERIKENIRDVSDNFALQQLRDISCCFYEYKDKINKGYGTTIGFIAQQVREHIPMVVSFQKNIIPNEMRVIENLQWTTMTDSSGNNTHKLTIDDLEDASGNTNYKFYMTNDLSGNDEKQLEIASLENEPKSFIFEEQWQNVFLYGKEVNDFHTIDKQKLFALNFSASQEIDRIQQEEKAKLTAAEAKLTAAEAKLTAAEAKLTAAEAEIATLKSTLTDVLSRLAALELN